jgi:hypothetical protein
MEAARDAQKQLEIARIWQKNLGSGSGEPRIIYK